LFVCSYLARIDRGHSRLVSAASLLAEAERRGARFRVRGDRLQATPANVFDDDLDRAIGQRKAEIIALLREREPAACATDAVLFAQTLLRKGHFARESAPCAYHCGQPEQLCRRCDATFLEH
jgi:hypothetical protein